MPYRWTETDDATELRLWAHRSLPKTGFAKVILTLFALIILPILALLGTALLWGVLPFALLVVGGLYGAFMRSYRDGTVQEILRIGPEMVQVIHKPARGPAKHWDCNRYWIRPEIHPNHRTLPHYITLAGNGRQVELGAFLSLEERKALFEDLTVKLRA